MIEELIQCPKCNAKTLEFSYDNETRNVFGRCLNPNCDYEVDFYL